MRLGYLAGMVALLALGANGCVKGGAGAAILGAAIVTAVAVDAAVDAAEGPDVVHVHHYHEPPRRPRVRVYRQCHFDHCHRVRCYDDECHYAD